MLLISSLNRPLVFGGKSCIEDSVIFLNLFSYILLFIRIFSISSSSVSSNHSSRAQIIIILSSTSPNSLISTSTSSIGPALHTRNFSSFHLIPFFLCFSTRKHVWQCWEQWLILTSPVFQSTSGLCLHNQGKPRIRSCLPRLVTAKGTCSEWSLNHRTRSTTSFMDPALFRDLSTL